jgi:lysozyme
MIEKVKSKNLFGQLVNMFNKSTKEKVRLYLIKIMVIVNLLNISAKYDLATLTNFKLDNIGKRMLKTQIFNYDDFQKLLNKTFYINQENNKILYPKFNNDPFVLRYENPLKLKTSDDAKEFIKKHELLRLDGYDLGDGRVLIGYGHYGNGVGKNVKYHVGDKITSIQAEKLFKNDIKQKEYELKRLFKQWKEKEGIQFYLTQSMFDCMISMAYNMGIYAFRDSEFIKELKKGNYEEAAELIKTTHMSSFPGLKDRRFHEYDLFTSNAM